MSTIEWPGAGGLAQVPFRRLFRPIRRQVPENAAIVTAYTDGEVTLRANRSKIGYHEAASLDGYQGVEPGDFVVHGLDIMRGSVGVSDSRGAISSVCTICVPLRELDLRYVAYLIREQAFSGFPKALARGVRDGGADFRRWDTLAELPIPVVEVGLQQAIADFLDRETAEIDEFVAESEKLITLLNERRAAVITQAVTKGLDPNAPMKDTGIEWLGQIPAHWRVSSLRHLVVRIEQGVSPEAVGGLAVLPDQVGVLKAGCVNWGWFNAEEHKLLPSDFEFDPGLLVQPGDLVVNRASGSLALLGSAALVSENTFELILSDKTFRLRAGKLATESFLYWLLNSRVYREQVEVGVSGADGLANNLPMSRLKAIRLPIPSPLEQSGIDEYLQERTAKIDEAIATAREANALAKERRQALISAAVTGKIDVRAAA